MAVRCLIVDDNRGFLEAAHVVNRFPSCDRLQARPTKVPFCRQFIFDVWVTGLGHDASTRALSDNITCLFAGTSRDGSDGTRTRDLRRDRPSRTRRRSTTKVAERPHLQALSPWAPPCSAWLSQSSDGRLGHEWATKCCQLRLHQRSEARRPYSVHASQRATPAASAGLGAAPFVRAVRVATFQTVGNGPRERAVPRVDSLDSGSLRSPIGSAVPERGPRDRSDVRSVRSHDEDVRFPAATRLGERDPLAVR